MYFPGDIVQWKGHQDYCVVTEVKEGKEGDIRVWGRWYCDLNSATKDNDKTKRPQHIGIEKVVLVKSHNMNRKTISYFLNL